MTLLTCEPPLFITPDFQFFPVYFHEAASSEKNSGKQYAYSMKALFFLIYFQILPETWKEFGKLIVNAPFSPVFPSDFQNHPRIWK
ncbi:MAG TPA: hypothetical protein DEO39_04940 [Clostridiales bacterium]|nr:hypothetical protein [Clostridiales bacterium]